MNGEMKTMGVGRGSRAFRARFAPAASFSFVSRSSFRVHRLLQRGLTLVELLTAMMVAVLLLGTAFSTFWTATQSWERAKRRSDMIRLLEGAAEVITRHLRSIQPAFMDINPVFLHYDDGDELGFYDSVSFLSSANPRFPRQLDFADLCEMEIYIDLATSDETTAEEAAAAGMSVGASEPFASGGQPQQINRGLWLRIDPTPDEDLESDGYLIELGAQITSLDFRFFDGYEWLDEWFDTTQVPQAIEFSLTATDAEGVENPMTLTRLVAIPLAKAINQGVFAGSADSSTAQAGSSSSGTPGSTQAGSPGGQTGSGPQTTPTGGYPARP